jgi:hypothetical protein
MQVVIKCLECGQELMTVRRPVISDEDKQVIASGCNCPDHGQQSIEVVTTED